MGALPNSDLEASSVEDSDVEERDIEELPTSSAVASGGALGRPQAMSQHLAPSATVDPATALVSMATHIKNYINVGNPEQRRPWNEYLDKNQTIL